MILFLIAIVVGIVLLTLSADRFVQGASGLALRFGLSPVVIGITIVAIGTSAPELLVSVVAAIDGNPSIAIGNAVGSNIANIGLALGVTATIAAISVGNSVMRGGLPAVLGLTLLTTALCWDQSLTRLDAVIILIAGVAATYCASRGHEPEEIPEETDATRLGLNLILLLGGLAVLIGSARLLVWGASELALSLGVPEVVVGLTIVAIGTSLPEIAACLAGALRGQPGIAIGNVIGSNIFNLGGVFSIAGLLTAVQIEPDTLNRDFLLMVGLTALIALSIWVKPVYGRAYGAGLVLVYAGYLAFIALENL